MRFFQVFFYFFVAISLICVGVYYFLLNSFGFDFIDVGNFISGNEISDSKFSSDVYNHIINKTVIGVCGAGRNKITLVSSKILDSKKKDDYLKIQAVIEWDESYGEYIVNRPCRELGRHRSEVEVLYEKFGSDWRIYLFRSLSTVLLE